MSDQPSSASATGDALLRAFLAERHASCPSCNYSLHGLTTDRCPECNQALTLRVNLVEPRLGWWVTGLVGLAAGAGFSGLLLLYVMTVILRERRWGASFADPFLYSTSIGFGVESLVLLLWCWRGRALRRWSGVFLAILAVACWVVTIVNFAVFAFLTR